MLFVVGGVIFLIVDMFILKPTTTKKISSVVSPDSVSSFSVDDIITPDGQYVSESDKSPIVSVDENGDYVIEDDQERYFINKNNNEILWIKKVNSESTGKIKFKIEYNIDAEDVTITIKSPSGKEYSSHDSNAQISNIGFTSIEWVIDNGEIGEYLVEIQGINIYSYYVKVNYSSLKISGGYSG